MERPNGQHTEPYSCQDIFAGMTTNGNSRRARLIYAQDGTVLDVFQKVNGPMPAWTRDLYRLPEMRVTPNQYREFCRMETARWRQ